MDRTRRPLTMLRRSRPQNFRPLLTRPARGSAPEIPPKIVVPFAQEAYRVVVEIGFNGQATEDPLLRQRYVDQIRKGLDRMYGAAWSARFTRANG